MEQARHIKLPIMQLFFAINNFLLLKDREHNFSLTINSSTIVNRQWVLRKCLERERGCKHSATLWINNCLSLWELKRMEQVSHETYLQDSESESLP